jgi:hypothetical protein
MIGSARSDLCDMVDCIRRQCAAWQPELTFAVVSYQNELPDCMPCDGMISGMIGVVLLGRPFPTGRPMERRTIWHGFLRKAPWRGPLPHILIAVNAIAPATLSRSVSMLQWNHVKASTKEYN